MKTRRLECSDQRLRAMLADLLSESENQDLLAHIEVCEHCQNRLDELAASKHQWELAAQTHTDVLHIPFSNLFSGRESLLRLRVEWNDEMANQLLSKPTHPEMIGRLGRYDIERLIGTGGMGVVFKAFDAELNRPVAIKLLAPFLIGSGSARQRFSREARAAAAVVHPHVIPIHCVETERKAPFIVMQYVLGESLQERIDRQGALDLREICRIGMQVADGLEAAHNLGLVHRDIKPSNILLEQGIDRALISDFGLARAADDSSLTRTGIHPGTPQYMSPEQAGGLPIDGRSDLFSLGSMLYTMCTGRPPFSAESSLGILRRIADSDATPIQESNPDVPKWLCRLIDKLMAKDPQARFESAGQVKNLLEGCLKHLEQPATVELPKLLQPAPVSFFLSKPGHVLLLFGLLLCCSIFLLCCSIFWFKYLGTQDLKETNAFREQKTVTSKPNGFTKSNKSSTPVVTYDFSFVPSSITQIYATQPKQVFQTKQLNDLRSIANATPLGTHFNSVYSQVIAIQLEGDASHEIKIVTLPDSSAREHIHNHHAIRNEPVLLENLVLYPTRLTNQFARVLDENSIAFGTPLALSRHQAALAEIDPNFKKVCKVVNNHSGLAFNMVRTKANFHVPKLGLTSDYLASMPQAAVFLTWRPIWEGSDYLIGSISIENEKCNFDITAWCSNAQRLEIIEETLGTLPGTFVQLLRAINVLNQQMPEAHTAIVESLKNTPPIQKPSTNSVRLTIPIQDLKPMYSKFLFRYYIHELAVQPAKAE